MHVAVSTFSSVAGFVWVSLCTSLQAGNALLRRGRQDDGQRLSQARQVFAWPRVHQAAKAHSSGLPVLMLALPSCRRCRWAGRESDALWYKLCTNVERKKPVRPVIRWRLTDARVRFRWRGGSDTCVFFIFLKFYISLTLLGCQLLTNSSKHAVCGNWRSVGCFIIVVWRTGLDSWRSENARID